MDVSSVPNLCLQLISCSFQRCRLSDDLCRLSVVLRSSPPPNPVVRISISDTGTGSSLEEFQDLKCPRVATGAENWDGLLSVKTTSIGDNEVYNYHINLRESISSRRLTRLPSNPKNGLKFRHGIGTEVCLVFSESVDALVADISCFFQKILILKIPNVAIELVAEYDNLPESKCKMVFLQNQNSPLHFPTSNIERLKSGFGDYVLKQQSSLHQMCDSCFTTLEHLKVGSGTACSKGSRRSSRLMVEVVVVISELESKCPYFAAQSPKTEVLYFKDFKPCSIPLSSVSALTSIDWTTYGLTLRNIEDQNSCLLEWVDLPPNTHIDMALHCYHEQYPTLNSWLHLPIVIPCAKILVCSRQKDPPDRNLIKGAVKVALDDLKEKYAGSFLSVHALKICSYTPELARSIAGLILSSTDPDFQLECFSLLGLKSGEIGRDIVEDCIKEKIVSVIERNDGKSQQSKEGAPFLFEDDIPRDSYFLEPEYEDFDTEGEHASPYMA
ncbi:hypothetical protein Tsubulata_029424 [Turnera subulata]|uniref:Type 2 DNA topoisomerase 6 subunit B-like n=1 Tax=Turnera subulata TaxID=218843 RepID=A0A9Q0J5H7_9ROSI|nr:hypothetical protein Tsubulata_029424 [Turnera subulata]